MCVCVGVTLCVYVRVCVCVCVNSFVELGRDTRVHPCEFVCVRVCLFLYAYLYL